MSIVLEEKDYDNISRITLEKKHVENRKVQFISLSQGATIRLMKTSSKAVAIIYELANELNENYLFVSTKMLHDKIGLKLELSSERVRAIISELKKLELITPYNKTLVYKINKEHVYVQLNPTRKY